MKNLLRAALLGSCLFAASPSFAEVEKYSFDTAHTQVMFFVNHLGFSNSSGRFLDFDGHFTFDRADPSKSHVEVTFKTDGLDMQDAKWDEHMKGADFFDVIKFPEMTFKSTSIEVTGENTANITGDLAILGVVKPVTLAVVHNKSGKHPFGGKYVSGFSATASLKRSDFGMKYGLPMVGDDVSIRIEVEGVRDEDTATDPASANK